MNTRDQSETHSLVRENEGAPKGPSRHHPIGAISVELDKVFSEAPVAIALLSGPDHRYERANTSYRQLIGNKDVLGQPFREARPELAGKGVFEVLDEIYKSGLPSVGTEFAAIVDRGGGQLEEGFFNFVYQPVPGDDGSILGIAVIATDVTAHVHARSGLEEAKRKLEEQAVELEQQAAELEQQATELEEQFEGAQRLGYDLEKANEDLRESARQAERAHREAVSANLGLGKLLQIGGALASEFDVEKIVGKVTDAATALTGAAFGAFFYNAIDAEGEKLMLFTLSGAPREAFERFGHPRATPVFAPTFFGEGIVRSDDITADPRYGQLAPHHGMPPKHLPVRSYLAVPVISRTSEVIGGLFFGHPDPGVFNQRAEDLAVGIASWAAIAMDNARLYAAEKQARADAERANLAKSQFLAKMSHELRTPLNAIGGYSDLMMEGIRGPVTEEQRLDLARIKKSQLHLLSLVNDILNVAKIESGKVHLELRDVSMNHLLGSLEPLVAPQLQQKNLTFEYECCDPRFTAFVDEDKAQQILVNLLSNAIKFTPPGGEIRIKCGATRDSMEVTVRDTGVGIPSDKLLHIFEPFVQLGRDQTTGNTGTGLGLAISRDLARAMQGDLTVESSVGEGSTFLLTLPRRAAAS